MLLTLVRYELRPTFTPGMLFLDGEFECMTLEDPVRTGPKVPGDTAIPAGSYVLTIDWSDRFQRKMPHILDVPDFTGIRIHGGNDVHDTKGCPLTGCERFGDTVRHSRDAFLRLLPKLVTAHDNNVPMRIDVVERPILEVA